MDLVEVSRHRCFIDTVINRLWQVAPIRHQLKPEKLGWVGSHKSEVSEILTYDS